MKKYLAYFKIRFIAGMQYRTAALAGIATQFAWGFMEILLYAAFYDANPSAFPMTLSQVVSYIWMQQAFLSLFMTWALELDIFSLITDGNIACELIRPYDIYSMWFVKNMAMRLSRASLRCMPILIVALFLPEPFRLVLPTDPKTVALFLVTMVTSTLVVVAYCMFMYIATFYTMSSLGVRQVMGGLTELLTGSLLPIPFMPEGFQKFLYFTPFYYMENLPLRVFSGSLAGSEAVFALGMQLLWIFVMIAGGKLWMSAAMKRVKVQGG